MKVIVSAVVLVIVVVTVVVTVVVIVIAVVTVSFVVWCSSNSSVALLVAWCRDWYFVLFIALDRFVRVSGFVMSYYKVRESVFI